MRIVILLLKMHRPFCLFSGYADTERCHYKLVLYIVIAVNYANYPSLKRSHTLIYSDEIDIKLLAVSSENAWDLSVIYRICKLITRFFMHISYRPVN